MGKTQVQTIAKEKDNILRRWKDRESGDYKYGKNRTCAYEDLNAAVLQCPFTQYSHIWLLDSRESRLAFDELRLR